MHPQQRLIDCEIVLARSRLLRTLVRQTQQEADDIRWRAQQERRYSSFLQDRAARLVTSAGRARAVPAIAKLPPMVEPVPSPGAGRSLRLLSDISR
jgi:hypothetical protein